MHEMLGITAQIPFVNVHRFGRFARNGNRPIVARFLFRGDLDLVKNNAYRLCGTPYIIREQFPQKMEDDCIRSCVSVATVEIAPN